MQNTKCYVQVLSVQGVIRPENGPLKYVRIIQASAIVSILRSVPGPDKCPVGVDCRESWN